MFDCRSWFSRAAGSATYGPVLALAALHASAGGAVGQELPCSAGRISDIVIQNHSVFDLGDPDRNGRFDWTYRLANKLHFRTDEDVIERELLFDVGDCFDPELLDDSERILRAFDFIADAHLTGTRQPDGTMHVVVETQDEWSTRIQPEIDSNSAIGLDGIQLVEDNLLGSARHVSLFYEKEQEQRIYGARFSTPQLFRTRWNLGLEVARTQVGQSYDESVTYPFVGEDGRRSFRQGILRSDRYFELLMPSADDELARVLIPVSREQIEVGAAIRRGNERYRHTLLGAAIAAEKIGFPGPVRMADTDEAALAPTTLDRQWSPISSVRLMLLAGQRNIWWTRKRAIDTVNGMEDIQLGMEAEASLGPTLPGVSDDRDIAVGFGLFAAAEPTRSSLIGGRLSFEGRRTYEAIEGFPEWNDVLAEVDLWAYLRPSPESRHTFVATLSAVGGWNSRVPYQLTLGGDSGLRGYPSHVDPGGRRVVASFEHRALLGGPLSDLLDLGTVAFLDVGKIWPGDVPFGTESPIRASVGMGLRLAFPPGSRQTFRLDVGFPAARSTGFGNVAITIGVGQAIGRQGARRDPQLARSARYGLTTSDFVSPPTHP